MPSRRANPALIGGFVLGAIALSVAAALVFGSGRFFQRTFRWVIFFDSSVTGLDVGAPVIFRGVTVGSVVDVAAYVDPDEGTVTTPVYIELVQGSVRGPRRAAPDPVRFIDDWVQKRGLRAQLKTQSLVTGKLYVDLGLHPDTPIKLVGLDVGVPEIPSVPTELEELKQTLQSAAARISELPLEEIVENLRSVTASLDRLLADPALEGAVANLDATLAETRELVSKLNGSFGDFEGDVDATLAEARKTFAGANAAIADARALVAPGSPLQYQLSVLLEELSRATRAVRALSESLARDPDQLIFGRGKPGGSP